MAKNKPKHPKAHIVSPVKPWWPGDRRVEKYMPPILQVLERNNITGRPNTDIYNRCYEAVYKAIKDFEDKNDV